MAMACTGGPNSTSTLTLAGAWNATGGPRRGPTAHVSVLLAPVRGRVPLRNVDHPGSAVPTVDVGLCVAARSLVRLEDASAADAEPLEPHAKPYSKGEIVERAMPILEGTKQLGTRRPHKLGSRRESSSTTASM